MIYNIKLRVWIDFKNNWFQNKVVIKNLDIKDVVFMNVFLRKENNGSRILFLEKFHV